MASLTARIETATNDFQKLQNDLTKAVEARQRLDSQKSENDGVLQEFALLKPHNTVYKLIGPGLVKQEQAEAKSNVEKRLEFINSEIKRVEANLQDLTTRSEKKKMEIVALQGEAQKAGPPPSS